VLIVACPCALALSAPLRSARRNGGWRAPGCFCETRSCSNASRRWTQWFSTRPARSRRPANCGIVSAERELAPRGVSGEIRNPQSAIRKLQRPTGGRGCGIRTERPRSRLDPFAGPPFHAPTRGANQSGAGEPSRPEPVLSFSETPGSGIEGSVQGHAVLLGSRKWLESREVSVATADGPSPETDGNRLAAPTPGSEVCVGIDGEYRGNFRLANALRPEVAGLVRRLVGQYDLALLSGDHAKEREQFRALFPDDGHVSFGQGPGRNSASSDASRKAARS